MGLKNLNREYNDSKTGFFKAVVGNGSRLSSSVKGVASISIPRDSKLIETSSFSSVNHRSDVTVSLYALSDAPL